MLTDACRQVLEDEPLRRRPGQLRIFRSPVLEMLTRSPRWSPFALYLPLLVWLLERHRWRPELVVLGLAMWLALEYAMHRFFFHLPIRGEIARGVRFLVHEHHHAFPDDPGRLVATPWQSALALALLGALARALTPGWPTVLAGCIAGYLLYEAAHIAIHHGGEGPLVRLLRRHHLRHHPPSGAGRRFAISCPPIDALLRSGD